MSVGFARAVAEGLRHNGVTVSFEPGWETRGNGQSFPNGRPEGLIVHHTGAPLGGGLAILVHGRPDLSPPLCNACIYPDGRVHIIAAHPANHAGVSGGRSMGPLPTTTLFNRRTWGVEIMYPGVTPWTPQQYRSALVLGGVISGILCRPNTEWIRGHGECSVTGKWDPGAGRGPGVPFDMTRFRREIPGVLHATDKSPARTVSQPAGPTMEGDPVINHPVQGTGMLLLICPVGKASRIVSDAWISAAVAGPDNGRVRFWFQSDIGGISDTQRDIRFANGHSEREWVQVPDGTTMIRVQHTFPQQGTVCLELASR